MTDYERDLRKAMNRSCNRAPLVSAPALPFVLFLGVLAVVFVPPVGYALYLFR